MIIDYIPKLSYNDICICPAEISNINSRSECNPYLDDNLLPIFTAPMSTVVNEENYDLFEQNGIHAILPRHIELNKRISACVNDNKWVAFSLKEFEEIFCIDKTKVSSAKVLIDVANGHMGKIFEIVKTVKRFYGDRMKIMVGNIANPNTYKHVFECGADYVRVSIGTGSGCITQSNTAIGYPIVSLISEMVKIKKEIHSENPGIAWNNLPKIVADGGIRNYSDIIKALAVGADYVMIGSVFAKMLESAAPITKIDGLWTNSNELKEMWDNLDKIQRINGKFWYQNKEIEIYKLFYGMASKLGQQDLGLLFKTSEGIEKTLKVEYTMESWTENFKDYLKSAMSYCNIQNIIDFKNVNVITISQNTFLSINA